MNVRDRIKAAEAISGDGRAGEGKPRKDSKLRLNIDEHIKEEVLKRGDGGWQKKVGIGQQDKYQPGKPLPPIIQLTAETPTLIMPPKTVSKKLSKGVPGAFESMPEEYAEVPSKSWSRVEQLEAEQQARMDAEAGRNEKEWERVARLEAEQQAVMDAEAAAARKAKKTLPKSKLSSVKTRRQDVAREISLLDDDVPDLSRNADDDVDTRRADNKRRERRVSNARHAFVVEESEEFDVGPPNERRHRGQVLFDPEDWADKKQTRRERRISGRQAQSTKLAVDEAGRNRARSKSPSIRLFRINRDDDDDDDDTRHHQHPTLKTRTGSRSSPKRVTERDTSPRSARRSSSFLWPSFSSSERKSTGDVFDTMKPRSSHVRNRSDERSISGSFVSDLSPRRLEFAEYVAGKRLSNSSLSPQKLPPRPMGFVRSRSHTGHYYEGYTRDKSLLRKPDDDEVIEIVDHDWERGERRHSRHNSSHVEDEPWQVRFVTEIARR